eukprot:CAMPEP_0116914356 /NCGR_PEP_ID=MMETSP0467-20121206/17283_1 /TAXON_ID=283647 /ORGANISM="Mesodinium pulex, Strain SPMC105" /LENGTH=65 /DNA_ID=CAMNT_0004590811 /DNA_START=991 /DNA_END=1188 /DNA_ORIENTATION=-
MDVQVWHGGFDDLSSAADLSWVRQWLQAEVHEIKDYGHCDWFWDSNGVNVWMQDYFNNIREKDNL